LLWEKFYFNSSLRYGKEHCRVSGRVALVRGMIIGSWDQPAVTGLYAGIAALRMPQEEALIQETFGEEYEAYKERTGRLLPRRQEL
jgi:protein-S-isoprenylcysteine O-methyltransferase Ste14